MRKDIALSVNSLSKKLCRNLKYSLLYGVADLSNQLIGKALYGTLRRKEFWAVQDVSFEIHSGQTLAIIGRNGAGKTTLLRLLAGLIKPNNGTVEIRGRVVPLIALGAGFSPALSAMENAETFLTLLAITSSEIKLLLPEIFSFAELSEKQDDPVSSFSSGMIARLAFACAVHAKPDILLIDEVLAVGDLSFHIRCYEKLAELKNRGVALILVSHNLTSVLTLADTVAYLEDGKLKEIGAPTEVCSKYEADLRQQFELKRAVPGGTRTNEECHIDSFAAFSHCGLELRTGKAGSFSIRIRNKSATRTLAVTILIKQVGLGGYLLFLSSEESQTELGQFLPASIATIELPYCGLLPGDYLAKVTVLDKETREILTIRDWEPFRVLPGENINQSLFFQPHSWNVVEDDTRQNIRHSQSAI